MFGRLLHKTQALSVSIRLLAVGLPLGLTGFFQLHPEFRPPGVDTYAALIHFLPTLLAGMFWGLAGGLTCAGLAGVFNLAAYLFAAGPGRPELAAVLAQAAVYFLVGGVVGFLADRERLENQSIKEAQSLALMGKAAATVAHELKTPLVAIGGFAQRMAKETPPGHPHHRYLEIIVGQAAHMERLLREMLDYSRPLRLNLAHHQLNLLVEEVISLLSHSSTQQMVRLNAELSPEVRWVVVDGARLKQVIINLVQNAVQATNPGGAVQVSTEYDGQGLVVQVRDNGKGIDPEYHERIFSPFYTTKKQGTGLGLAICRRIVEAHRGRLLVESRAEHGSTFRICLPQGEQK